MGCVLDLSYMVDKIKFSYKSLGIRVDGQRSGSWEDGQYISAPS